MSNSIGSAARYEVIGDTVKVTALYIVLSLAYVFHGVSWLTSRVSKVSKLSGDEMEKYSKHKLSQDKKNGPIDRLKDMPSSDTAPKKESMEVTPPDKIPEAPEPEAQPGEGDVVGDATIIDESPASQQSIEAESSTEVTESLNQESAEETVDEKPKTIGDLVAAQMRDHQSIDNTPDDAAGHRGSSPDS